MMITFPESHTFNARNHGGQKETIFSLIAVAKDSRGDYVEPARVRCYMGRSGAASRVYCSAWFTTPAGLGYSGSGWAGGGGYCKKSAAFAAALDSAGIAGVRDLAGRGESAMRRAVAEILTAAGWTDFHIVEC